MDKYERQLFETLCKYNAIKTEKLDDKFAFCPGAPTADLLDTICYICESFRLGENPSYRITALRMNEEATTAVENICWSLYVQRKWDKLLDRY